MRFKIGRNCVVDPAANQIFTKNGAGEQNARLEPRMMRVLVLLAEQPGEVLSREFLIETIWENKFVGEEALTQAISRLRKVFGDNPHQPQFIETIPKNGYRIIADIERNHDIKIPFNGRPPQINRKPGVRVFTISSLAITALVFSIAIFLFHHF